MDAAKGPAAPRAPAEDRDDQKMTVVLSQSDHVDRPQNKPRRTKRSTACTSKARPAFEVFYSARPFSNAFGGRSRPVNCLNCRFKLAANTEAGSM